MLLPHLASACASVREKAGLEKQQIADAIGVHPSNVGRFESGAITYWPRNADHYVNGYAAAAEVSPASIWLQAIEGMESERSGDRG